MKQEDKDLLLKDLCGRLPYGVKCKVSYNSGVINDADATLYGIDKDGFLTFDEIVGDHREFLCKPYLFPLSSMTEEQKVEYREEVMKYLRKSAAFFKAREQGENTTDKYIVDYEEIDWLNKNHFDYRGLIPMGLANDATRLNIY